MALGPWLCAGVVTDENTVMMQGTVLPHLRTTPPSAPLIQDHAVSAP